MPFCSKCGKKIEEGEVCSCQSGQAAQFGQPVQPMNSQQAASLQQPVNSQPVQQPVNPQFGQAPQPGVVNPQFNQGQQATTAAPNPVGESFKKLMGTVGQVFKAPANGAVKFANEGDFIQAAVLTVVRALLFMFVILTSLEMFKFISELGNADTSSFYGIFDLDFELTAGDYVKAVIFSLVGPMVVTAACAAVVSGLHGAMNKVKLSFDKAFKMISITYVYTCPAILLLAIFLLTGVSFLITIGFVLYAASEAIATGMVMAALRAENGVEDKNVVIAACGQAVKVFILFVILGIML